LDPSPKHRTGEGMTRLAIYKGYSVYTELAQSTCSARNNLAALLGWFYTPLHIKFSWNLDSPAKSEFIV